MTAQQRQRQDIRAIAKAMGISQQRLMEVISKAFARHGDTLDAWEYVICALVDDPTQRDGLLRAAAIDFNNRTKEQGR